VTFNNPNANYPNANIQLLNNNIQCACYATTFNVLAMQQYSTFQTAIFNMLIEATNVMITRYRGGVKSFFRIF